MVTGEDRGVAPVIGFILIFSFLIIAFSIYQGVIIPDQNKQAEFQHNERTQGQLLNLQDAIRRTGTTGVSQSVSIQVGADYPDRTLGVNFAVTGGRVATDEPNPNGPNNITFENVRAVRPEVRDYWNSSDSTLQFPTKDIVYRPEYTRYNTAPETVLSNTGVFNQFDGANISLANQILIQGNRITIVAINGSLDRSRTGEGESVSVDTEPLSVSTNSITVENNNTGQMNLTVPTTVANESVWNESSLKDQDAVNDTTVSGHDLTITLENGTYSLRMAKVGVGTGTADPDAEYLADIDTPIGGVSENSSSDITLEVRDAFNNPINGFQVNATIETAAGSDDILSVVDEDEQASGTGGEVDANSTADGRVRFNYTAPDVDSQQPVELNFTIYTGPHGDREQVWVNTTVLANGGNDGGSDNNNDANKTETGTESDDAGSGGASSWNDSTSRTVTQPGGVVYDIQDADSIVIRDPTFTSINPDGTQFKTGNEYLRLQFNLQSDIFNTTEGETRYYIRIAGSNQGFLRDFGNTPLIKQRTVFIARDTAPYDGTGYEEFFEAEINKTIASDFYNGTQGIDLLNKSNYDPGTLNTGTFNDLDTIKAFLVDNSDAGVFFADMNGRVNLSIIRTSDSSADRVNYVEGSGSATGNNNENVSFSLYNFNDSTATITKIAVNATDTGNVDDVNTSDPEPEFYTNRTGSLDEPITIGGPAKSLDTNSDLPQFSKTTINLEQFRKNGNTFDVSSNTITATIYFADGSEKEIEIST